MCFYMHVDAQLHESMHVPMSSFIDSSSCAMCRRRYIDSCMYV